MPGTTAGGLPYPLTTEPVKDGATAIKNLADAIDTRFGAGGGAYNKVRFISGMYSTGADGRVWIPSGGVGYPAGGVGSILGASQWFCRPYSVSPNQVLWEVYLLSGAVVANTAMTFNLIVFGS